MSIHHRWVTVVSVLLQCYNIFVDEPQGTAAGFHLGITAVAFVLAPSNAPFLSPSFLVVVQTFTLLGHLFKSHFYWKYLYFSLGAIAYTYV